MTRKRLSEEQIDKMCELYRTRKCSLHALRERFGLGLGTIRNYLKERGIPPNSNGTILDN
jgi:hypothetical protein